jgi:hypothetical protein
MIPEPHTQPNVLADAEQRIAAVFEAAAHGQLSQLLMLQTSAPKISIEVPCTFPGLQARKDLVARYTADQLDLATIMFGSLWFSVPGSIRLAEGKRHGVIDNSRYAARQLLVNRTALYEVGRQIGTRAEHLLTGLFQSFADAPRHKQHIASIAASLETASMPGLAFNEEEYLEWYERQSVKPTMQAATIQWTTIDYKFFFDRQLEFHRGAGS